MLSPYSLIQPKFYIYTVQTTFCCDMDDINLVCMVYFLQYMNISFMISILCCLNLEF